MASSARIDELRKKFDENPRRYFAPLANEYRKAGDLEQAVFICQEYLPQQPGHMSGHIVYGQALYEMGRLEEAQIVFETALSLDPENLIALRHLGDIARQTGDTNAARIWYQRVLEADPRNEEIAQIMISLLAAPEPPPEVAPPAEIPAGTPAAAATAVNTTFEPPPSRADSGLTVEKSDDAAALHPLAPQARAPAPPPPPHTTAATKARDGQDFLDLGDFNLGGVPPDSVANAAPEPALDESPSVTFYAPDDPNDGRSEFQEPDAPFHAGFAEAFSQPADDADDESPATAFGSSTQDSPSPDEGVFHLGAEEGPFEADPFAIASVPPEPMVSATDLELGLATNDSGNGLSDGTATESALEDGDQSVHGLESYEPGVITSDIPAITPTSLEMESFFDPAPRGALPELAPEPEPERERQLDAEAERTVEEERGVDSAAESRADLELEALLEIQSEPPPPAAIEAHPPTAIESEPEPAAVPLTEAVTAPDLESAFDLEPAPELALEPEAQMAPAEASPPVQAFVTETMAELYLQQGHLDSALEIYRQLADQRPGDAQLLDRLRAVEDRVNGRPEEVVDAEVTRAPEEAPAPAYGGPTIREFLMNLTARRTPAIPEEWTSAEVPPSSNDAESEHTSMPMPSEPASPPASRSSGETVRGSIDALFSGAGAEAADASAASTLQQAFAPEGPETAPLQGMPAHRASSELSLDHVFKGNTPARSEGDGFSFDQFFAEDMADPTPNSTGESSAEPTEATDDIAQFNAWLNGLKKT